MPQCPNAPICRCPDAPMTILTMAGINDPPVKLLMTGVNFFILYMLQLQEMLDPSETPRPQNVTADWLA